MLSLGQQRWHGTQGHVGGGGVALFFWYAGLPDIRHVRIVMQGLFL